MAGCGKPYNGNHTVTGASLRCGQCLYWKVPGENDKTRTQELILCDECREKEKQ